MKRQSGVGSDKRFRALIEHSSDAVLLLDSQDIIVYASPALERILGYTPAECMGRKSCDILHPDQSQDGLNGIAEVIQTPGKVARVEALARHKDGSSRWIEYTVSNSLGEPSVQALTVNVRDVTHRKQAAARLRRVVDTTPALIHSALPNGDLDFFNQQWLDYLGVGLEEIRGWGWTTAIHPEDVTGIVERWRACLATGEHFSYEARVRRGDGEYRWMLHHKVPLRDERGIIVKWYGSSIDIEDVKRAERELQRREAYLAEAQRLSHTGSFGWNISSGEIYWSEETFRIFAYDRTLKLTVDLILQRVHPEDVALVKRTIECASRDAKDFDLEHRLLMLDGSIRYVHVVGHAVRDPSGSIEFVGAIMDVTKRKQAEGTLGQTQAALAHATRITTLGVLTASIAHEVNQPLAAMVTNTNACVCWLAHHPPNLEEARQTLERILADGHRAGEVLGRIRGLVRNAPPKKTWMDINETIGEVLALARGEAQRRGVALAAPLAPALPRIWGDRVQVQQVLLNLLLNGVEAVQEVREGPREVQVSSESDGASGVRVAVRDSGPGLDASSLDRLFDAFYTTKPEGLGMGLAISRSIIEAHGGRLWAEANVPRGAVFQFTLPAEGEKVA